MCISFVCLYLITRFSHFNTFCGRFVDLWHDTTRFDSFTFNKCRSFKYSAENKNTLKSKQRELFFIWSTIYRMVTLFAKSIRFPIAYMRANCFALASCTHIRRFLFTFRHSPDRRFRLMNITHSPSTCVDLIISHNSTVRVVAYKVNIIICYPHLENCRIPTFQGEIKIIHRFCFVGFCLGNIRVNVHCSCMILIYDVSLQFVIYSLIFIE